MWEQAVLRFDTRRLSVRTVQLDQAGLLPPCSSSAWLAWYPAMPAWACCRWWRSWKCACPCISCPCIQHPAASQQRMCSVCLPLQQHAVPGCTCVSSVCSHPNHTAVASPAGVGAPPRHAAAAWPAPGVAACRRHAGCPGRAPACRACAPRCVRGCVPPPPAAEALWAAGAATRRPLRSAPVPACTRGGGSAHETWHQTAPTGCTISHATRGVAAVGLALKAAGWPWWLLHGF